MFSSQPKRSLWKTNIFQRLSRRPGEEPQLVGAPMRPTSCGQLDDYLRKLGMLAEAPGQRMCFWTCYPLILAFGPQFAKGFTEWATVYLRECSAKSFLWAKPFLVPECRYTVVFCKPFLVSSFFQQGLSPTKSNNANFTLKAFHSKVSSFGTSLSTLKWN